ncbi:MAG TPA: amidohydrolase family protein [Acidimicrobiales bacterium]|jgi:predicted TIM-barrel fold metal-dependent hydrolase|nr:amidohydrolase family protein [Acidimicrobiales bacterium]
MNELPWIISVDDHVVEPPTVWTDRLSASDRERGPRVVRDTCHTSSDPHTQAVKYVKGGDGPMMDWWLYEDLAKPIPKVVACAGIPVEEHTVDPIAYDEMRPGCYDPKARLADMDLNRTERSLCFPYVTRFAGQMFLDAKDKDLALRCVQAYNDWMIDEWCGDSGGRLLPLCIVPLWDPGAAAKEVRRNAGRGARAITFTEMPHHLGLPSIHDPSRHWDPLFDACDETGTVVCMHIGSGSKMAETSPFAPRAANTTLTFSCAQLSMVEWLVSGLLVRFPKLKIAYSESQIGWMPFILERLDKVFHHSAYAGLDPIITQPPSTYVPGRVYGCFFDDDTGIANRDAIGITQMVFEVDYPHQDTTWPHTNKVVERMAEQMSPDELERVLRLNALEMLGLPA